ncbi:hypothetical protein Cni_G10402 [Canna indica]|uniref:Uncharacterized protein n=1 Tax=Canna indica TaxID=4628 RepID=A0AAQ3K617_9LILI|nr:hypothetical protein Cni_G10402 [Canna indica]
MLNGDRVDIFQTPTATAICATQSYTPPAEPTTISGSPDKLCMQANRTVEIVDNPPPNMQTPVASVDKSPIAEHTPLGTAILRRSPRLRKMAESGTVLDRDIKRKKNGMASNKGPPRSILKPPDGAVNDAPLHCLNLMMLDNLDMMDRLGRLGFVDVNEVACECIKAQEAAHAT